MYTMYVCMYVCMYVHTNVGTNVCVLHVCAINLRLVRSLVYWALDREASDTCILPCAIWRVLLLSNDAVSSLSKLVSLKSSGTPAMDNTSELVTVRV